MIPRAYSKTTFENMPAVIIIDAFWFREIVEITNVKISYDEECIKKNIAAIMRTCKTVFI